VHWRVCDEFDECDKPLLDLYRSVANESPAASTTHAVLLAVARYGQRPRRRRWRAAAIAAAAAALLLAISQFHPERRLTSDAERETVHTSSAPTTYLVRLQRSDSSDSDVANYLRTQDLTLIRQEKGEL